MPRLLSRGSIAGLAQLLVLLNAVGGSETQATVVTEPPLGQINEYFRISGDFRTRYENWGYFDPRTAQPHANSYDFVGQRARLGVVMTTPWLDGMFQAEYTGLYGLPSDSVVPPAGALGMGANYYVDSGARSLGDVHLKQAYLDFKGDPLGLTGAHLKLGRFEILEGLEYKSGDGKFDWLKTARISQRLIGPFDFTFATRNFDGVSAGYGDPNLDLTLTAAHPTQGGFNARAQDQISHIDIFYASLTGKKDAWLPGTEQRLFYIYYGDDRNVQVTDNRPLAVRPKLSQSNIRLHTLGTHWLTLQTLGRGSLDGIVWAAGQFGEWTSLNQRSWAVDGEVGYQWTDVPLKPWIRAVYYRGSGDENPADGTHGTFFQILPTNRPFAKFPFFNLMNIQDVFASFILQPLDSVKVAVDVHHLALANSADGFYGGAGATSRTGSFGFSARDAKGRSNLGELLDIGLTHQVNRYLSWNVYYAHAFGGAATDHIYQTQGDADYGFIELNSQF